MIVISYPRVLRLIVKFGIFGIFEPRIVKLFVHMAMTEGLCHPREGAFWDVFNMIITDVLAKRFTS